MMAGWVFKALIGLAVVALGYLAVSQIYRAGAMSVMVEWQAAQLAYEKEIAQLKSEYAQKEEDHQKELRRIENELASRTEEYEASIRALGLDYDRRLRLSNERIAEYQRHAEAGPLECKRLADHAGRLDRTLEEGRSLVRELRITLGHRDSQLKILSQQIQADRALCGATTNGIQ